jgi:hypothetical protein
MHSLFISVHHPQPSTPPSKALSSALLSSPLLPILHLEAAAHGRSTNVHHHPHATGAAGGAGRRQGRPPRLRHGAPARGRRRGRPLRPRAQVPSRAPAGGRGDRPGGGGAVPARVPDRADGAAALLADGPVDALSGLHRRPPAGGRVPRHRLRQHHRLLGAVRALARHGPALLPGVRRQPAAPARPHSLPLRPLPALLLAAALRALAQHVQDPSLPGPGPRDHGARAGVHPLLPPRPLLLLHHPPAPRVPPITGDHAPARRSRGRRCAVPRAGELRAGRASRARRARGGRRGVGVQLRAPRRAARVRRRPARCGAARGGAAHGGVARRVGPASAAGRAELRVGVPGVVVVRGDDPALRPPAGPEAGGGVHGRAYADDGAGVRVPLVAGFRGVHAGGQRAGRQPPGPRARGGARGRGRRGGHGARGHVVRGRGAPRVGAHVHRRRRHPPVDRGRAPDRGALRARQLPADRRLRRAPRQRAADPRRARQPGRLLPGGHARGRAPGVRARRGLRRALDGPPGGAGVLRRAHALRRRLHRLGGAGAAGAGADVMLAGRRGEARGPQVSDGRGRGRQAGEGSR